YICVFVDLLMSFMSRLIFVLFLVIRRQPRCTLFPYTTLFRSADETEKSRYLNDKYYKQSFIKKHEKGMFLYKDSFSKTYMEKDRSEEHTSELQSRFDLVCRLLLEKKNKRGV